MLNLTSYKFYLNEDAPAQITENSMQTFLQNLVDGNVTAQGGRSWLTRIRRMIYEITTNIHDMFYHQPILTLCLFGVPLAFFSIIFYSVCSADFSVDRNEIYPDEEEDDEEYYRRCESKKNLFFFIIVVNFKELKMKIQYMQKMTRKMESHLALTH